MERCFNKRNKSVGDKVFNIEGETFYAFYMKSIDPSSVIPFNTPKFFTLKDEPIIRLEEDEKQGKVYIAEGTKELLNGVVKLGIIVDEQEKIHINFLDKEGNSVKIKGAVKMIMPIKEDVETPYRVKVNGVYTTYGEENGCYSIVLRPTADVGRGFVLRVLLTNKKVFWKGQRKH